MLLTLYPKNGTRSSSVVGGRGVEVCMATKLIATITRMPLQENLGSFSLLAPVLLGYKVLGICIFAVKIMDITFRVFIAKISVFVFQLTTNFQWIVSFITCSLRLFLLVTLPQLLPSGLGFILLVRNYSPVTNHGASMRLLLKTAETL